MATSTFIWDSKLSKPAVLIMMDGDTFDIGKQLVHFNDYFCLSLRSTPLRCQEQNQTKVELMGEKHSLKHFFSASLARYYCSSSSWADHHVKVHIWNIFVMEKRYKRISEHINVKINKKNIKQTNIPVNSANIRIFSNIPHTLRA